MPQIRWISLLPPTALLVGRFGFLYLLVSHATASTSPPGVFLYPYTPVHFSRPLSEGLSVSRTGRLLAPRYPSGNLPFGMRGM